MGYSFILLISPVRESPARVPFSVYPIRFSEKFKMLFEKNDGLAGSRWRA
jgi:hypothetical protein